MDAETDADAEGEGETELDAVDDAVADAVADVVAELDEVAVLDAEACHILTVKVAEAVRPPPSVTTMVTK